MAWSSTAIRSTTSLPYSGLTNLGSLYLGDNQISDISALSGLTNLWSLNLEANPLNEDAYNIYIPQIRENNPGIKLHYDPYEPPTPEPPEKPLQAELAIAVIGAHYLGDGYNWGGKGYDCFNGRFASSDEVKTLGYFYYDARIKACNTTKETGLDCSGLPFWSYNKAFGATKPVPVTITGNIVEFLNPMAFMNASNQYKYNTQIKMNKATSKRDLMSGDLIFFKTNGIGHVAMYTGDYPYPGGTIEGFYYPPGTYDCVEARSPTCGIVPRTLEDLRNNPDLQKLDEPFGRVTFPVIMSLEEAEKAFGFKLTCPASLIVTDPEGFTVKKDVTEVPDMVYLEFDIDGDSELDDMVLALERKVGDYSVTVVPEPSASPTDTYSLEVIANGDRIILAEDVAIKDITAQPYIVRTTEDEIMTIIQATVDFDPDTLNLKSKGKRITVYIELPVGHGYNVSMIDLATLMLNGQVKAEARPTEIGDYDSDSVPDFMVKFDRSAVQEILEVGNEVEITVTGELTDGTHFEGIDTIRIIDEGGEG